MIEARQIFTRAENPERHERKDGVIITRNSGKNSGHYGLARKASEKYRQIVRLLEQTVLKDQNDQDLYDETMLCMLSRQLLTLWKAYPNDYKEAVEVGKRTLKIHSRLRAEIKQKTDIVEVIFLHRFKLISRLEIQVLSIKQNI